MLKIYNRISDIDFDGLCSIYEYDDYTQRNDLYDYLTEDFFRIDGSIYAVWMIDGQYVSGLRMEPYKDGYLVQALQTRREYRGKGYAKSLLGAVLIWVVAQQPGPVYAHIFKNNLESLAVHRSCGFEPYLDYAVFIDGTVSSRACTVKWINNIPHQAH